jgi:hypothetical protein
MKNPDNNESAAKLDACQRRWLELIKPQPPKQNHLDEYKLWKLALNAEMFQIEHFR